MRIMREYKIGVIPGDGIGPEVIKEGIKVLEKISEIDREICFRFETFPWGSEYYLQYGRMMPDDGLETLKHFDAIYLGAVGDPRVRDDITLRGLLLEIRQGFDQYVNLRPVKLLEGIPSPLRDPRKVDMLIVRENSEGEYAGCGERLFPGKENEVVLQTGVFSKKGTERIIRYAFEKARKTGAGVTSLSKGNALNYSMVFWDEIFEQVSRDFPDVHAKTILIDAACMMAVMRPEEFQVVVTSNLFGDIFSDIGAAIGGGMGMAAGANINPERKYPSMFEPVHGSAPDIAGTGKANPVAAIWAASQMIEFLGEEKWSRKILAAIESAAVQGMISTPDMGGTGSTEGVGEAVCRELAKKYL